MFYNIYPQRELKTQLLIFGLFDVFIVLVEIVSCALAAAYVAQISRRQKAYYWNDPGAANTLVPMLYNLFAAVIYKCS